MICVKNVTKSFGRTRALDGFDMTVKQGSVYGLIGKNGAGKTTILKLIAGVLKPDCGDISIAGAPVFDNECIKNRTAFNEIVGAIPYGKDDPDNQKEVVRLLLELWIPVSENSAGFHLRYLEYSVTSSYTETLAWFDRYRERMDEERKQLLIEISGSDDTSETAVSNWNQGWNQEPSIDPVETVRSAIENQINEDYTISVEVENVEIDESETLRIIKNYTGSELAKARGWTDEYLAEHFIAIKASYYAEYDGTKIFISSGYIVQFFYLAQDIKSGKWTIVDNTTNMAGEYTAGLK